MLASITPSLIQYLCDIRTLPGFQIAFWCVSIFRWKRSSSSIHDSIGTSRKTWGPGCRSGDSVTVPSLVRRPPGRGRGRASCAGRKGRGGKGGGEHSRFGETAFVGEPVGRGLRAGRAAHTRLCLCMQTWRLLRRKQQGPLSRLATRLSGHGGGKKQTHRLRAILGG